MRMRLTHEVEQEDDGERALKVEVSVHQRRGGVAELQPAGAEWHVRWLREEADLNRQGNGTATVQVAAPGLYRVRSVASARRARNAYVEVTEVDGALRATVLGVDEEEPRTVGATLQALEARLGITEARAARAAEASRRGEALADALEAGSVRVSVPLVALTLEGLDVPPLQAASDKQLAYARVVRARAVHDFLGRLLERAGKLPRATVEEQLPLVAGWLHGHLRAHSTSRYWLDETVRADPELGVLGEAYRKHRAAKAPLAEDTSLHMDLEWTCD
ncbi:hypothetical protein [Corallococcus sp. EGB]|uniref:hypothetical protein n=1 Tax=Corallococcus sp. EGB TaxID=1521117 RepID=UPI001CBCF47E|nr:hypothetical protein [Corallococcus sp. EGB]